MTRGSTVGSVDTMYDGSLQPEDVAGPSDGDGDGDGGNCCAENDLVIPNRKFVPMAPTMSWHCLPRMTEQRGMTSSRTEDLTRQPIFAIYDR